MKVTQRISSMCPLRWKAGAKQPVCQTNRVLMEFDSVVSHSEAHSGYPYDKWVSLEHQTVTSSKILWAMCSYMHKHAWVFWFWHVTFLPWDINRKLLLCSESTYAIRWHNRLCQGEGRRTLIDCAYWTQLRPVHTLNNSCHHYKHCPNCNNVLTGNFQRVVANFF